MFNNRNILWFYLNFKFLTLFWVFVSNLSIPGGITNHVNFKNKNIVEYSNYSFDSSHYYMAAVIDYSTIYAFDYQTDVLRNLQHHIGIIEECKNYMVDIVVFPECGLYGCMQNDRNTILKSAVYVPSPAETTIPCYKRADQTILRDLSCAALANKIYVVVVLMEKYCTDGNIICLENELLLYNTQVVFDRNGMIIARYRKFNLYTERWTEGVNQTEKPELSTFTTDFNVEFGQMICFDIMFANPGLSLVKQYNITHMIHSADMMSRLPFIAVTSMESGWSYSTNTILLTSTLSNSMAIFGTNIYFGRREYTQTYVKYYEHSKIIISPVPKTLSQPLQQYPQTFHGLTSFPSITTLRENMFLEEHVIRDFTTKPLLLRNFDSKANFTYTSDTFECTINITWIQPSVLTGLPNYQLAAYSGPDNYSIASINNYAEICGLTLCADGETQSCELPPTFDDSSKLWITSLNISAMSRSPYDLRIPATLGSNLLALDTSLFQFDSFIDRSSDGEAINIVDMKLTRPSTKIVAFGIYKFFNTLKPIPQYSKTDLNRNADAV